MKLELPRPNLASGSCLMSHWWVALDNGIISFLVELAHEAESGVQ